jgi:hypothetical protein
VLESVIEGKPSEVTNLAQYVHDTYQQALTFWSDWLSNASYKGRWSELIHRSAITLKLQTSSQFGTVIAAAILVYPKPLVAIVTGITGIPGSAMLPIPCMLFCD